MAFQIPTLDALARRTSQAFRANLKGSDAELWPNNVAVTSKVVAGAVWEAFAYLDYIARQIFVATADTYFLERHAAEYGMARLPATYAEGAVVLTGDSGVAVPAGLILQRADGVRYETLESRVLAGGAATIAVRCLTAGKIGNARPGAGLMLAASLGQINDAAEVAPVGIGLGADPESDAALRSRVLFRKRFVPHGGAAHDYVTWAREVNGVSNVFVDPVTASNGRVSVGVWFLMRDLYANGIPQAADVAKVAAAIDAVRPAGALVDVAAPVAVPVPVTVHLYPDTTATREAVTAELADLFSRAPRVSTLSSPVTVWRSKISESVSIAAGEDHHTLVAPAGDVILSAGEIAVLGTVTFTA